MFRLDGASLLQRPKPAFTIDVLSLMPSCSQVISLSTILLQLPNIKYKIPLRITENGDHFFYTFKVGCCLNETNLSTFPQIIATISMSGNRQITLPSRVLLGVYGEGEGEVECRQRSTKASRNRRQWEARLN